MSTIEIKTRDNQRLAINQKRRVIEASSDNGFRYLDAAMKANGDTMLKNRSLISGIESLGKFLRDNSDGISRANALFIRIKIEDARDLIPDYKTSEEINDITTILYADLATNSNSETHERLLNREGKDKHAAMIALAKCDNTLSQKHQLELFESGIRDVLFNLALKPNLCAPVMAAILKGKNPNLKAMLLFNKGVPENVKNSLLNDPKVMEYYTKLIETGQFK